MRARSILPLLVMGTLPLLGAEPDAEGCKDHPLFTRMAGYRIANCETKAFDAYEFQAGTGKPVRVEGRRTQIAYTIQKGVDTPGRPQVLRNYENAVKAIGGTVLATVDDAVVYLKAARDGKEFWVEVNAYSPEFPAVVVVEKAAMKQEVVANAEVFASGLRATGHVAVYGIYFDTNKSDVKPESTPALAEIAKLLKKDPGLKLYVVGHTDSTGFLDANMKLSQARGESVVRSLVAGHGIAAARLKGLGVGPAAPVASNDTEEGKAKNRRVELVKQ
jgi:outer membrane protein OmpA-like peptidoglycan-associated protein